MGSLAAHGSLTPPGHPNIELSTSGLCCYLGSQLDLSIHEAHFGPPAKEGIETEMVCLLKPPEYVRGYRCALSGSLGVSMMFAWGS